MAYNNLKKILTEEGLTQAKLAAHCGLCSGTVNRIANGKKSASPRTFHRLVKGLSELSKKTFSFEEIFPNAKKY